MDQDSTNKPYLPVFAILLLVTACDAPVNEQEDRAQVVLEAQEHDASGPSFLWKFTGENHGGVSDGRYAWLAGDVDGDGKDDLIRRYVKGSSSPLNHVLLSNGDGTFESVQSDNSNGANGDGGYWWLTGDFNGDGATDLARRRYNGSSNSLNKILFSNRDGTFTAVHSDSFNGINGDGRFWWFAGDVNGDGRTDLVRRDANGSHNKILLARPNGSAGDYFAGYDSDGLGGVNGDGSFWYMAGDFNGDGRMDLVRRRLAPNPSSSVLLAAQDGKSFLLSSFNDPLGGIDGDGIHTWLVGDVNGDGRDDLVRRSSVRSSVSGGNALLLANPGGTSFTVVLDTDSVLHYEGDQWFIGRVNDDALADLILRAESGEHNRVLLAREDGTGFRLGGSTGEYFGYREVSEGGTSTEETFEWVKGDFTGDGLTDLARRAKSGQGPDTGIPGEIRARNLVLIGNYDAAHNQYVREARLLRGRERSGERGPYDSYRAPALVSSSSGRLLVFAEGRYGAAAYGQVDVVLRTSDDGGKSWSVNRVLVTQRINLMSELSLPGVAPDGGTVGAPTGVVDGSTGEIFLFFIYTPAVSSSGQMIASDADCQPGDRRLYLTRSIDDGITWSTPELQHHLMLDGLDGRPAEDWDNTGPGTGIYSTGGKLIIPARRRNIYSEDHGQTWSYKMLLAKADCDPSVPDGCDPLVPRTAPETVSHTIVELADGGFLRNDQPPSEDGVHYRYTLRLDANQAAIGFWRADTDLLDPGSQASILRHPGPLGMTVFVNSGLGAGGYWDQMVARSGATDGTGWTHSRVLDYRRGGYSSLTHCGSQFCSIQELNESSSAGSGSIIFRRFNAAWLRDDPLVRVTPGGGPECEPGVCTELCPCCDDQNACTVDVCDDPAPGQHWHYPVDYDDGDACTIDTCDPATGPQHLPLADDQNACTVFVCDSVTGEYTHLPVSADEIDDGNLCTRDYCDPVVGIVHEPVEPEASTCVSWTCDPAEGFSAANATIGTPCGSGWICDGGGHCVLDQGDGTPTPLPPPYSVTTIGDQAAVIPRTPVSEDCTVEPLDPKRTALITGYVFERDSAGNRVPAVNARASVVESCAAGSVLTRADGSFLLPVNGGANITIRIQKDSYLAADRRAQTIWGATSGVDEIELVPLSPVAVPLLLGAENIVAGAQVLQGERTEEVLEGGFVSIRTPSVLFKSGTEISAYDASGHRVELSTATVRMTEYTVGANGLERMPAPLPAGVAYTYAVELSIDEANGANRVEFDRPVVFYVDNFVAEQFNELGVPPGPTHTFEVGDDVPVWFYDRDKAVWERENDGIIIELVGVDQHGDAVIDVTGDGAFTQADHDQLQSKGLVVDADELTLLGSEIVGGKRSIGDQLWRVERLHFSPLDCNWLMAACGSSLCSVGQLIPEAELGGAAGNPNLQCGSVIEVENRALTESVEVAGTPWALHYNSNMVTGYQPRRRANVYVGSVSLPYPLSYCGGAQNLTVAGRSIGRRWGEVSGPRPDEVGSGYVWDGLDANGRPAYGTHKGFWNTETVVCALFWNGSLRASYYRGGPVDVTMYDAKLFGFGGWSFTPLHFHDRFGARVFEGFGRERRFGTRAVIAYERRLRDLPSSSNVSPALLSDSDGGYYYAFSSYRRVWHVAASGVEALVYSFPGGSNYPIHIATDRRGTLYVADNGLGSSDSTRGLFKVEEGAVTKLRGDLDLTEALAIGPDDRVYVLDRGSDIGGVSRPASLRRLNLDGSDDDGGVPIATFPESDGAASRSAMRFGADGALYLAHGQGALGWSNSGRVYRWTLEDGPVLIAGGGTMSVVAGRVGLDVRFSASNMYFSSLVPLLDGSLLFSATHSNTLWRLRPEAGEGQTVWVFEREAGSATWSFGDPVVNDVLALDANLKGPQEDFVFDRAPDGSLLVLTKADEVQSSARPQLRRIIYPSGMLALDALAVASEDGSEVFEFNERGRHQLTRGAITGDVLLSFVYGEDGLVSEVVLGDVQASGSGDLRRTRIHRDTPNEVSIESPFGHRTTIELDPDTGYARRITDASGGRIALVHDAGGLLRRMVDRRDVVHAYDYTDTGVLTSDKVEGAAAQTLRERYSVDLSSGSANAIRTTVLTTSEASSSEFTVAYHRGTTSRQVARMDGRRFQSSTSRTLIRESSWNDSVGQGTKRTDAYELHPLFGEQVLSVGKSTTILPSGTTRTEQLEHVDSGDEWIERSRVNGRAAEVKEHRINRSKTIISPAGRVTTVTYDNQRRPVYIQIGDGPGALAPVTLTYDSLGRVEQITSTAGLMNTRSTGYDYFPVSTAPESGYLRRITNSLGQEVTFERDPFGRATKVTTGGHELLLGYDAHGNLTSVTTPQSHAHGQGYNNVNLLGEYTAPGPGQPPSVGGTTTTFHWDGDRKLESVEYPGGFTMTYSRDGLDEEHPERFRRLRALTSYVNGGHHFQVKYAYADEEDEDGPPAQLRRVTRGPAESVLGWDGPLLVQDSLVAAGELQAAEVAVTPNNDFAVAAETVSSGGWVHTSSYGYDADGRVACATWAGTCGSGTQVSWAYDTTAGHGLLQSTTAGEIAEIFTNNAFGELATHRVEADGSPVFEVTYDDGNEATRDGLGRIATKTIVRGDQSRTIAYTYDAKGQLTAVNDDGEVREYQYDANGNRCRVLAPATDCLSTTVYDEQDRLVGYDDGVQTSYHYTPRGTLHERVRGGKLTVYNYDALGNLLFVDDEDEGEVSYTVDGFNRRIARREASVVTHQYVWSGALRIVAELDGNGTVVSRFVYGSKVNVPELVVQPQSSGPDRVYKVITDHLGSPVYVVNVADPSDVLLDAEYDEWGRVTSYEAYGVANAGWPIPFGFAGGLYDETTGLVRFGARDYDPEIGRWTSKDPILFGGGQANLYVYTGNDPNNFVDPEGEAVWVLGACAFGGCQGAAAALGSAIVWTGATLGAAWAGLELGKWLNGRFTPDQEAAIDLAKEAKKTGGLSAEEAKVLVDWAKELGLPARGPEAHPGRPFGKFPHIHVGPVNHVPVCK